MSVPPARPIDRLLAIMVMLVAALGPVGADADTWTPMNEPGFGDPANSTVLAMAMFDDHLYVATRNHEGGQIWKSRPGSWRWREVTPGWAAGTTHAMAMAVFDGRLYVGTSEGEVWRTAGSLTFSPCLRLPFGPGCLKGVDPPLIVELWSRVTPTSGAWRGTEVTSLAVFGGRLFLTASAPLEIWRSTDGLAWGPVVDDAFDDPENNHSGKLRAFGEHLYVGTSREVVGGPGGAGDGLEIWRTADGLAWSAVVATGETGAVLASGFGLPGNTAATALAVFQNRLYVSTVNHVDGAQIWRFDGTGWEEVTPAEAAFGVVRIQTLGVFGRRIFAGQGITPFGAILWGSTTGADWGIANAAGFGEGLNTSVDAIAASRTHLYVATQDQTDGVRLWQKDPSLLDRPLRLPRECLIPKLCSPPLPIPSD